MIVDPELYALRPWYHDFSAFGFDTTFLNVPLSPMERVRRAFAVLASFVGRVRTSPVVSEGSGSFRDVLRRTPSSHVINQPVKDRHLMSLVGRALSELGSQPGCLELFSSDGYYSCRIKSLAPQATVTGVELDPDHVRRAEAIARRLSYADVTFRREDVHVFLEQSAATFDLVLCAGGLYHMSDPGRLLQTVKRVARRFLVIQSVVTLETEDPKYFVQPAPGWQHGCRFTHAWLRAKLAELGWQVRDEERAELPGNPRPADRGSSFFLCAQP